MRTSKFIISFIVFLIFFAAAAAFLNYIFVRLPAFNLYDSTEVAALEYPVAVIDAGHGGEDGGASGFGLVEKDLNLDIASRLACLYEISGLPYRMTREDDRLLYKEKIKGTLKTQDLRTRLEIAEEYENAVFISIHMNKFPIEKYYGLQVWYSPNNENSLPFAETIRKNAVAFLQPENERLVKKAGSSIYLLNRLNHPAVLVECGFLSNEEEAKRFASQAYRSSLAAVLFCSIVNFG